MIIPIELRFTADKNSKSAFRTDKTIKSHDVNSVEFHITIDGLELTDDYTAKILSVFHSSKTQVNVDCEISEGKIIYKPDATLISIYEHVTNYVYVYNNNQSLDVREFIYTVDLSKIDETSLEVKEVYDQSYADLLADFEQALSDYKDSLPQADSVRADIDEVLNQFGVDSQVKLSQYDTDAQQAIADNQTAFDLAESGRQEEFDTSQSERQQQFDDAQSVRQESYEQTQSLINEAESLRAEAEGQRESAESSRKANESDRMQAEINRENTEDSREQSEGERKANEADRVQAEDERENAEVQRKIDHANRSAEFDGKADKVVLNNFIVNGDFSKDTDGDGIADGWRTNGSNATQPRIENNTQYWMSLTPNWNGSISNISSKAINAGHQYYISLEQKNVSHIYMSSTKIRVHTGINSDGYLSRIITSSIDGTGNLTFYGRLANTESSIKNVILVDLTEAFGTANEPTEEEMDELIEITGYIDGEYTLNNKEMLNWQLKLMRQNRNALIALGGTII